MSHLESIIHSNSYSIDSAYSLIFKVIFTSYFINYFGNCFEYLYNGKKSAQSISLNCLTLSVKVESNRAKHFKQIVIIVKII